MSIDHGTNRRSEAMENFRLNAEQLESHDLRGNEGNVRSNSSELIRKNKISLCAIIGGLVCTIVAAIALGILFGPYAALTVFLCGAIIGVCIDIVAKCCIQKSPSLADETAMNIWSKEEEKLDSARKEMDEALSLWPSQGSGDNQTLESARKEMNEALSLWPSQGSGDNQTLESARKEMNEALSLWPSQGSGDNATLESARQEMNEAMSILDGRN